MMEFHKSSSGFRTPPIKLDNKVGDFFDFKSYVPQNPYSQDQHSTGEHELLLDQQKKCEPQPPDEIDINVLTEIAEGYKSLQADSK